MKLDDFLTAPHCGNGGKLDGKQLNAASIVCQLPLDVGVRLGRKDINRTRPGPLTWDRAYGNAMDAVAEAIRNPNSWYAAELISGIGEDLYHEFRARKKAEDAAEAIAEKAAKR